MKWSEYHNHLSSRFQSLRSQEQFTDVTLYCEGKNLKAHQMVLAACSSYFQDVLQANPHSHPVIIFQNVKYRDLVSIIQYMYNGEVCVAQERLMTFLQTAEMLKIEGLTETGQSSRSSKSSRSGTPLQQKETVTFPEPARVSTPTHFSQEHDEYDTEESELTSTIEHSEEQIIKQESFTSYPPTSSIHHNESYNSQQNNYTEPECMISEPQQNMTPTQFFGQIEEQKRQKLKLKHQEQMKSMKHHSPWGGYTPRKRGTALSKEKIHQCSTCTKRFMTYIALCHHKAVHKGLTKCHVCDRVMSNVANLKLHLRTKHADETIHIDDDDDDLKFIQKKDEN